MPKTIVIDELHLTVRVPADVPKKQARDVREALLADEFMDRLRRAVRRAFREVPKLTPCHLSLER